MLCQTGVSLLHGVRNKKGTVNPPQRIGAGPPAPTCLHIVPGVHQCYTCISHEGYPLW